MKAKVIGLGCLLFLANCKDKTNPEPPFFPIEDYTFEAVLVNKGIDEDKTVNGKLVVKDIAAIKSLDISNKKVTSLAGIEAFTSLEILYCATNPIKEIDLSRNPKITRLYCGGNSQLTKLTLPKNIEFIHCNNSINLKMPDLTQFSELKSLDCNGIGLQNINLRQNPKLQSLSCSNNRLTSLDLSNNEELSVLVCSNNQLTALNLDKNVRLSFFSCSDNRISQLKLDNHGMLSWLSCGSNNMAILNLNTPSLQTIYCQDNVLKELDVSKITNLQAINCRGNELERLDFSNNEILKTVGCSDNQLTSIKFKNTELELLSSVDISRNNVTDLDISKVLYLYLLDSRYNPLKTICVADTAKANANLNWKKPSTSFYKICK